jgi:hypothetical protein
VTATTRAHVESIYLRNLEWLDAIFAARLYLLGGRPTLADFGFFASMFRHFGLDPTPARLMRDRAPNVYEWVARMWNAKASRIGGASLVSGIPEDWQPILSDIGGCYLPYLDANARAFASGRKSFEVDIENCRYSLPVHAYRVWCLERLQRLFRALPEESAGEVRALLERTGALAPFLAAAEARSGFDPDGRAPFFTPSRLRA